MCEAEGQFFESDISHWYRQHEDIEGLMKEGKLPFDTFFRLAAIGQYEPDPTTDNDRALLVDNIIRDLVDNADTHDDMRPDTQRLIFGDQPAAIIDPHRDANRDAYTALNPMYYRMGNLASIIKGKRHDQGKSISEVPVGVYMSADEYEWRRCIGLARPTWRVLAQRVMPQIFERPDDFYGATIIFDNIYYVSKRTAVRRLVAATVICDSALFSIYQEVIETGVKGIGAANRDSLRLLLAEEHPELYH